MLAFGSSLAKRKAPAVAAAAALAPKVASLIGGGARTVARRTTTALFNFNPPFAGEPGAGIGVGQNIGVGKGVVVGRQGGLILIRMGDGSIRAVKTQRTRRRPPLRPRKNQMDRLIEFALIKSIMGHHP